MSKPDGSIANSALLSGRVEREPDVWTDGAGAKRIRFVLRADGLLVTITGGGQIAGQAAEHLHAGTAAKILGAVRRAPVRQPDGSWRRRIVVAAERLEIPRGHGEPLAFNDWHVD